MKSNYTKNFLGIDFVFNKNEIKSTINNNLEKNTAEIKYLFPDSFEMILTELTTEIENKFSKS